MTLPPARTHRRGNPNWGHAVPFAPALPTEFELRVKQLRLTVAKYSSSAELHTWCQQNRNRCYIPEWLLEEWKINVDLNVSPDKIDRHFSRQTAHFLVS
jgi:hypothetical protein